MTDKSETPENPEAETEKIETVEEPASDRWHLGTRGKWLAVGAAVLVAFFSGLALSSAFEEDESDLVMTSGIQREGGPEFDDDHHDRGESEEFDDHDGDHDEYGDDPDQDSSEYGSGPSRELAPLESGQS